MSCSACGKMCGLEDSAEGEQSSGVSLQWGTDLVKSGFKCRGWDRHREHLQSSAPGGSLGSPVTTANTPKPLVAGAPWAPSEFRGEPVVLLSLVLYP